MKMRTVERIDIAIEQIEDALQAYFDERYHSALVLASAAEQLFAGYVMKYEQTPSWNQDRATITKISNGLRAQQNTPLKITAEKGIGNHMNRAYNNSKHAGKTDHSISMDQKFSAQRAIERAIYNYEILPKFFKENQGGKSGSDSN